MRCATIRFSVFSQPKPGNNYSDWTVSGWLGDPVAAVEKIVRAQRSVEVAKQRLNSVKLKLIGEIAKVARLAELGLVEFFDDESEQFFQGKFDSPVAAANFAGAYAHHVGTLGPKEQSTVQAMR